MTTVKVTSQHPVHKNNFTTLVNNRLRIDVNTKSMKAYLQKFDPRKGSYSVELKDSQFKDVVIQTVLDFEKHNVTNITN